MPVYEYRCECGKTMDVLVRGGAEPTTCADAMEAADWCGRGGRLARQISAPYVASAAAWGFRSDTGEAVRADTSCGHCGSVPGSCGSDDS